MHCADWTSVASLAFNCLALQAARISFAYRLLHPHCVHSCTCVPSARDFTQVDVLVLSAQLPDDRFPRGRQERRRGLQHAQQRRYERHSTALRTPFCVAALKLCVGGARGMIFDLLVASPMQCVLLVTLLPALAFSCNLALILLLSLVAMQCRACRSGTRARRAGRALREPTAAAAAVRAARRAKTMVFSHAVRLRCRLANDASALLLALIPESPLAGKQCHASVLIELPWLSCVTMRRRGQRRPLVHARSDALVDLLPTLRHRRR